LYSPPQASLNDSSRLSASSSSLQLHSSAKLSESCESGRLNDSGKLSASAKKNLKRKAKRAKAKDEAALAQQAINNAVKEKDESHTAGDDRSRLGEITLFVVCLGSHQCESDMPDKIPRTG
jgi:hypothetical protein